MATRKRNTNGQGVALDLKNAIKTPTGWLIPAPPLTIDRPCGAPPGPRGFFITATPMTADGKPDGCEFALAKCETEGDARVLLDHIEPNLGSFVRQPSTAAFRGGHAVQIRAAADLHEDDRRGLERRLEDFLRVPRRVGEHRLRGGKASKIVVESPRLELTLRLTDEARRLSDRRRVTIAKAEGRDTAS